MFREVTPVGYGNLKTDRTDYRERCWKRSHARLTLLNVIDSSTKRFLEILSNVLVAQGRSLSFTYGRPDQSCGSFTLIYFGKCRASRINLFFEPLNFADIVSIVVMVERESCPKIGRTHCF